MKRKPYRVISFDAGALLALAYIPTLECIEQHLGKTIAKSGAFDMAIGASTGSIVATCIKYGMTAKQIKKFYLEESQKIFTKTPVWNRLFYKFEPQPLQRAFENYLGNVTWEELGKINPHIELVVVMWNLSKKRVTFVSSHRPNNEVIDFSKARVVDILMACCAAPYAFPPRSFRDTNGNVQVYADGGIFGGFGCNPSALGVSLITPAVKRKRELHLVSLGIGDIEDLSLSKEQRETQRIYKQTMFGVIKETLVAYFKNTWNASHYFFEQYGHGLDVTKYLRVTRSLENNNKAIEDAQEARKLVHELKQGKIYAYLITHPEESDVYGRLAAISEKKEIRPLTKEKLQKILKDVFALGGHRKHPKEFPERVDPVIKDMVLDSNVISYAVTGNWKNRWDLLILCNLLLFIAIWLFYKMVMYIASAIC